MQDKEKIAVFIDADNAPAKKIDVILSELATYGVVNIRRAYGNWKSPQLAPWENALHEFAIQPMQQFDLVKGKNATDMALVIDVMDMIYTKDIDIVALVSSDCDFTPLVTRILAEGKMVLGFGERKAPIPFTNACSKFLYLDEPIISDPDLEILVTTPNTTDESPISKKLKGDTKLINLLRQAISAVEEDDGWAMLGPIGTHISNHASFDQRNYGYKKLSELFAAIDLFEMKKSNSSNIWVRDKRKKSK